jgi:hypothetical protein
MNGSASSCELGDRSVRWPEHHWCSRRLRYLLVCSSHCSALGECVTTSSFYEYADLLIHEATSKSFLVYPPLC